MADQMDEFATLIFEKVFILKLFKLLNLQTLKSHVVKDKTILGRWTNCAVFLYTTLLLFLANSAVALFDFVEKNKQNYGHFGYM